MSSLIHELMPLHENIYAVSRDYEDIWTSDERFQFIGLYDGVTENAIPGGSYYFYLEGNPDIFNYYLTGHGLRQADKDRAIPADFSAQGTEVPIFGGYVDSHMGHFLVEVLARGIDFSAYRDHPIVFLMLRNRINLELFFKYCSFFGLEKKQIAIVDTPVVIPEIYIPNPQFFITCERIEKVSDSRFVYINKELSSKHVSADYFSDRFLDIHRKKGDTICPDENTVDRILYLSCVKSKKKFGEYIVHRALKDRGHTVIIPEEHAWESVISLVRSHKHVVGLRGSAMHFLMFCRDKKKVTYYDSDPELQYNFYNLEQMMQNDMEYVQVRAGGVLDNPKTKNLFRFEDISFLLKKLDVENLADVYYNFYSQVIIPNHLEYWRKKIGENTE